MTRLAALGAGVWLMAAGCVISADGEIPDVEVTQPDIKFPGFRTEAVIGEPAVSLSIPHTHDRLGLPGNAFREVRVREVSLLAKTGLPDLGFIRTLRVSVAPTGPGASSTAPVEIARYERTEDRAAVGPLLRMPSVPPVNVIDAWRATSIVVLFEVSGELPEADWSVDLSIRYLAELKLD